MSLFSIALGVLAVLLLLSGLDDMVPLIVWLWGRAGITGAPPEENSTASERRIAIFVPCWHESAVIGNMVRHNLAAIRYRNFDFFLGVYPNDAATLEAVRQLAHDFPNVHVAECPHPGPTSKADCLNWAYARMELYEDQHACLFDTIILHDAEDLIHPQALPVINRERARYHMVQVPVLPLQTGFEDVTHGVYCDEFSEYQVIDMRARQICGSFVPSNGVGTGFAREVLDRLARENNYQVFDPASLTEDYAIGVTIHAMGYRQCFFPITAALGSGDFIATREYFPRTVRTAIRQRTRWITGIALQCWERFGWRGSLGARYWFWRDRKGLITNPLSLVANAVFIAGVLDGLVSVAFHRPWHFTVESRAVAGLCASTLAIQCVRTVVRASCAGRIFGWQTALAVPLRAFHGNLINSAAAFCAVRNYLAARLRNRALAWQKTDHAYPDRAMLHAQRRELADVIVGCGYLSEAQIDDVRARMETGAALDLLLLSQKLISEDQLCRAVSLQAGLPTARLNPGELDTRIMRAAHLSEEHGFVPFAVRGGKLLIATSAIPSPLAVAKAEEYSELAVEFQLVTQSMFEKLRNLAWHRHSR